MHELYELKEMLCEELKEYGSKDKLDVGGLEIVDKLSHAIKNIDKIIETYEEEGYSMTGSYEGGSYRRSYAQGGNQGGNQGGGNRGGFYARGRGGNARRDSMGRYSSRYSRDGYSRAGAEMVEELRELMQEAPDNIRQDFQSLIQRLEQM